MKKLAASWSDIPLRTKITGVTVFILFLGLLVAGVGTLALLRPLLINSQTTELLQLRNDPTSVLARGANPNSLSQEDVVYANRQYYVAVIDLNGNMLYSNSAESNKPTVSGIPPQVIQHPGPEIFQFTTKDGREWRGVLAQITSEGEVKGALLIGASTALINETVAQYVVIFSGFGIAVILLGAALTRLLVTTTFLPLAEVERTALEIARGDTSKRILVSNPHTEVGHLGSSLNVMLDRLDGSLEEQQRTIERMRRFISDASHELRTPLVSVRGYAELYRMGALAEEENIGQAMERIEKEAMRMTALVEDLLALARLDERRPLQMKQLNLCQLAQDAALDTMAQDPERTVTVHADNSALPVQGDENKVRQLMTNLLGNALRHTPAGSPIDIVVQPAGDASHPLTRFEIVDHGEGIPAQLREKIFDRFYRTDSSRNRETGGSGLGLAIVKSIVEAHGGTVCAVETPGGGATFRVELPATLPGSMDAATTGAVQTTPTGSTDTQAGPTVEPDTPEDKSA